MPIDFTLIIPIHNEEAILRMNAVALHDYLKTVPQIGSFEIIFSCNGCTDRSVDICGELAGAYPGIRYIEIEGRGLGKAIREGADDATYEAMMFYAIDLPFGLSIIGESIEAAIRNGGAVVIGSKGHEDSVVQRGAMRWLFSGTISVLNNLLFGLGVKDTQGSILFYKEPLRRYGKFMDSQGAFFQTQILIYSKLAGLKLVEIPVNLKEVRKTRFKLAGDGLKYMSSIFKEKKKIVFNRIK